MGKWQTAGAAGPAHRGKRGRGQRWAGDQVPHRELVLGV